MILHRKAATLCTVIARFGSRLENYFHQIKSESQREASNFSFARAFKSAPEKSLETFVFSSLDLNVFRQTKSFIGQRARVTSLGWSVGDQKTVQNWDHLDPFA